MESLSPLSPDERQYEDLRYSPDDFDATRPISQEAFKKFFAADAHELIAGYAKNNVSVSRYLKHEAAHPDQMIDPFYLRARLRMGRQTLTWGNFARFRTLWFRDWDEKHGYNRSETSDSPLPSVPSE